MNVHKTERDIEHLTYKYVTVQSFANLAEITSRVACFKLILESWKW
jgi:hypothetical protein